MDFKVLDTEPPEAPENGVYAQGLYLDGCRWNHERCQLEEPEDRVMVSKCPSFWLLPCIELQAPSTMHYDPPVYVTPSRHEILKRKSYQRNFVLNMRLPSSAPSNHWIRRGAAAYVQL